MRKPYYILILVICVIFFNCGVCHSQQVNDTIICISPDRQSIKQRKSWIYSVRNDTIYILANTRLYQPELFSLAQKLLEEKPFCIFLDKKLRKIEEGNWDGENFCGNYHYYYKNGNVQSSGYYCGSLRQGKWTYYKKNGEIKSSVQYD